MRYTKTGLAVALTSFLAIGTGCHHGDNGSGGRSPSGSSTFNQLENCSQTNSGQGAQCVFAQGALQLQFTDLGGGQWQAVTVPDSGWVAVGPMSGGTFNYSATSSAGYSESGSIEFNAAGTAYSGSSSYVANDNSFTGQCRQSGAIVPNEPPNAPGIGACP
jgi:hypothetical protein